VLVSASFKKFPFPQIFTSSLIYLPDLKQQMKKNQLMLELVLTNLGKLKYTVTSDPANRLRPELG